MTERIPMVVLPAQDGIPTGGRHGRRVRPTAGLPQLPRGTCARGGGQVAGGRHVLLADDREVRWGAVDQGSPKKSVQGAMLTQPSEVTNVTSRGSATIS